MPEHLIEVYNVRNGRPDIKGRRHATIRMPIDSTTEQMGAAATAAKSAVTQMLAHIGVRQQVEVLYIPNAPTAEELDAEERSARNSMTAGHELSTTADILRSASE